MTTAPVGVFVLPMIDCVRLAAIASLHPGTVKRVYGGLPCETSTRRRLELAARKLGLPAPPPARSEVSRPELRGAS